MLLGATFTQEFAVEAAAVCNPSAVPAPDQGGLAPGELRAVLSVRQIGEGHRSSIGFRTVVVDDDGAVTVARRGPYATTGVIEDVELDAEVFRGLATDVDAESIRWVLNGLGSRFTARRVGGAGAAARSATGHAPRRLGHVAAVGRTGGALLRGPVPCRRGAGGARAHPGVRRRVQRGGGRPVRALRRRRRRRHLLRDLHRVRRLGDRPAAPRHDRLRVVHVVPSARCRGGQQGPRPLPTTHRWALPRTVAMRRRAQRTRGLRRPPALADGDAARCRRPRRGAPSSSATAVHRSSSTRVGSC